MVQGYPKKDSISPSLGYSSVETSTSALNQSPKGDSPVLPHAGLRILVNIRMNNGVNVKECIRCGCLLPLAIGVD